jgi:hypothetical protein
MQVPLYHSHFEYGSGGRCDGYIGDALVVASPLESLHFHLQEEEEELRSPEEAGVNRVSVRRTS